MYGSENSHRALRHRPGAVGGVVSAAFLFAGVAGLNLPRDASDAELLDWWAKGGNQVAAVVSMYCFAVAGLAFLVFLAHLRSRLAAAEGGDGAPMTALTSAGGVVFVAMLFVAAVARGVIGATVKLGDNPVPGVDVLRYVPELSSAALGVFAMPAAGLTIAATSVVIMRTGVFSRWVGWIGWAAVVLILIASAAMVGALAIPAMLLWMLGVSLQLWPAPAPTPATDPVAFHA